MPRLHFSCYIRIFARSYPFLNIFNGRRVYRKRKREREWERAESTTRPTALYIRQKLFCMRAWAFRSSSFWAAASFSFERWPFVGRVVSCVENVAASRAVPRLRHSKIQIPRENHQLFMSISGIYYKPSKDRRLQEDTHTHTYSGVECKN